MTDELTRPQASNGLLIEPVPNFGLAPADVETYSIDAVIRELVEIFMNGGEFMSEGSQIYLSAESMDALEYVIRVSVSEYGLPFDFVEPLAKALIVAGAKRYYSTAKLVKRFEMMFPKPGEVSKPEPTKDEKAAALAEAYEGCATLREDPRVLRSGVELVAKLGVVGEEAAVTGVLLTLASTLTEKPNALILTGASSGGKSTVMLTATRLMPEEKLKVLSGGSPKSLIYSRFDYAHSLVVLYEAPALRMKASGNEFAEMMRTLMSEGRLIYEKVEIVEDVPQTVRIEKEGPIGLITCNVSDKLDAEFTTRVISIGIDGGADQTAQVLTRAALRAAGHDQQEDHTAEITGWHCFIRWLAGQPVGVVIPFAPVLRDLIQIAQTRTRRDFEQVLSMIRASAILHRCHREIDADGRVIATLTDYEAAYTALHVAVEVAAERQPAVELLRLLDMIKELMAEATVSQSAALPPGMAFRPRPDMQTQLTISLRKLAEKLHMSKSSVQRLVKQAKADGFLRDREDRIGVPMILELGDAVTETVMEDPVLPTPDRLAKHIAGATESR